MLPVTSIKNSYLFNTLYINMIILINFFLEEKLKNQPYIRGAAIQKIPYLV